MHLINFGQTRKLLYLTPSIIISIILVILGVVLVQANELKQPTADVVYVDASAAGANDGTSWENAYTDLQSALTTAISGTHIWVAAGVYKPTAVITDRIATFELVDGVALYGGFPTGGGTFDDRDPDTNLTVLSGDIDSNDLAVPAADTSQIMGNNSYHVVTGGGAGPTAILDGFIISGGQANGSDPNGRGGGMYNDTGSSPTLASVIFSGNSASEQGGGMYNFHSSPTLTSVIFSNNSHFGLGYSGGGGGMSNQDSNPTLSNVTFSGNSTSGDGGGMLNSNSSSTLMDVIFSSNSAMRGGGMYNVGFDSVPTLTNVTFTGNLASEDGGGMCNVSGGTSALKDVTFSSNSASVYGGGMYNYNGNPTLMNVTFNGNSASGFGGGMANRFSTPALRNVNFSGNSARQGGGMYDHHESSPTLMDVIFSRNSASEVGGGMYDDRGSPVLMNVTFNANSTPDEGGGMYNSQNDPKLTNVTFSANSASRGGGIYNNSSDLTLTNVTFSGNFAFDIGGGIHSAGGSPEINNSILWGNTANGGTVASQQVSNANSQPFIHSTLVQGSGGSGANWDSDLGADGGGNLEANPIFLRNPDPGLDTVWGTTDDDFGDLRLHTTSPAIDAGDNSAVPPDSQDLDGDGNTSEPIPFDQGGNPRFVDVLTTPDSGIGTPPIVDMGAFEAQPFLSLIKLVTPSRAGLGQQVAYQLIIHNVGPETATGVVVTDVVPISVTVTSMSSSIPITETVISSGYVWHLADLPMGNQGIITLTGVVSTALNGGETLWNTAVITANESDPNLQDNQATVPLYVTEIIYVDASANGAKDGTSWANAYTELPAALGRAYLGSQIWVAVGDYKPTTNYTDRTATFQLMDGAKMYGGFPPGGSIFAARDPAANPTVLSGDIDDNDLSVPAANATEIVGNNSYHVVTSDGVRSTTVLDGFIISGGQANGAGNTAGGGLYNINDSRLSLKDIVFSGNRAIDGGGMYNAGSRPRLVDVTFQGNAANTSGGGLYTDDSDLTLTNVTFRGNKASNGGGVYNGGSDIILSNVLFAGNATGANGGGLYNNGGNPELDNTTFAGNDAGNLGGGVYNQSSSAPQIDNSVFWGNTSASANLAQSQIANVVADPVIHYCLVQGALGSGSWDTDLGIDGGGNVDADPAFVRNPDPGSDASWGTGDDDYGDLHLQAQSHAIDAGDNSAVPNDSQDLDGDDKVSEPTPFDLDGESRFIDVTTTPDTGVGPPPIVDMGAYEAQLRLRVRVTREDESPAAGARIYHLPTGQTANAEPLGGLEEPLLTNVQGVLQAPGGFQVGDGLLAVWPSQPSQILAGTLIFTEGITVYHTSASPTLTGIDWHTITDTEIVQLLIVSPDNPLILFDLDVSLEWDARQDTIFLDQLSYDLQRASELMYDWTNGQAALGQITVYHDRAHWNDAHIRVYASNRVRPNAYQGGIVSQVITDPLASELTYVPGQVRMGATWNRYGDPGGSLGEDWPRTLAHELGHYALFLNDNYLGLDAEGHLISVDSCIGTAMTDPYREDYSEFHPDEDWLPGCERTLSHQSTGRSDWATITTFYPWLKETPTNPGPSRLPLAVTQIQFVEPITPFTTLEVPIFYLSQDGGRVQPGSNARAFLLRKEGNQLIDLGRPTLDRVLARGAREDDRLCVFELGAQHLGCETIQPGDEELELVSLPDWQPDVIISPVTSRTMALTVTNVPTGLVLNARLFPVSAPASPTATLTAVADGYAGQLHLEYPAFEGHVQVWVEEGALRRETITDYAMGGNPGRKLSHFAPRGSPGRKLSHFAPVLSADGQVMLFGEDLTFEEGEFFTLQAATTLPSPLLWATVVGQAYRLSASPNAPDLSGTSISFGYLGSEVTPGEEEWLRVYYWDGGGWEPLPTELDAYHNMAAAPTQDPGLYALMSSIEIPLHGPGWDIFPYLVQGARPVTEALQSLEGYYSTVYGYHPQDTTDPWKVYDVGVPDWVNDLIVLEFGEGYWISVTEQITLYLTGGGYVTSNSNHKVITKAAVSLPMPPATYYGNVLPGPGFEPAIGMPVTAWVGDQLCGQGQVLEVDGQLVYSVNVFPDGPGGRTGCGTPDQRITFRVNSQAVVPTTVWNNDRVWKLALSSDYIAPGAPTATFSADVISGNVPLDVTFTAVTSGTVEGWLWNFGDDGTASSGPVVSHTYAQPGTFDVSLIVSNTHGATMFSKPDYITVRPSPGSLTATFSADVTSGTAPLDVTFTAKTSNSVEDWLWRFGDRETATTGPVVSHIYQSGGHFDVTLIVTGPGGIVEVSKPDYITVHVAPGAPTATFIADVTSGDVPLDVTFTAVTSGTVEGWLWHFGDGGTASTGPIVGHTYVRAGTFDVSLFVSNTYGSYLVSEPDLIHVAPVFRLYLPLVLKGI
jgi:uncharacterized repeat protein (TIGR01451 family)